MTAYILKLLAIITMTIDHFSYIVYPGQTSWMNCIGRIAFPIFAFQISEGYTHTHNLKKYFSRLILFALISQLPYAWFHYSMFKNINLNIIFTLILGLLSIHIYQSLINKGKSAVENGNKNALSSYKSLAILVVVSIALLAEFFYFDYGAFGIFLIFFFYILRNKKILRNIVVIILTFLYYTPTLMASNFNILIITIFLFTILPLIFINLYNGKKGKNSKLLFYIYYPVHLIVLCLIYQLIQVI